MSPEQQLRGEVFLKLLDMGICKSPETAVHEAIRLTCILLYGPSPMSRTDMLRSLTEKQRGHEA